MAVRGASVMVMGSIPSGEARQTDRFDSDTATKPRPSGI